MLLALAVSLVIGVVLVVGGCNSNGTETSEGTGVIAGTQIIESLTPQEAFTLIQDNLGNPAFVILDVRTPLEFADGHIENAILRDYYSTTFRDRLDSLDKNREYLIYCQTGMRSGRALAVMEELSFLEVYNMLGGIDAWQEAALPIKQHVVTHEEDIIELAD